MKKFLFTCIALFVCCVQTEAQKYLNVFQDGIVIKKILASDVESITISEKEPYMINMWSNGEIIHTFASEEVDSIKVIDDKGGPLSYIGIIGFNNDLHPNDIGLLSNSTVSNYMGFINNLQNNDGTILYYAVDNALDVLAKADIKTPLTTINLVTFTDGLDQGSIMKNPKYSSSYLNTLSKRIKDTKYKGLKLDAYSIGLRGNDVTDVDLFQRNLKSLASSDKNAVEVRSIDELRTHLQEIANKIINVNYRQTISVKIPGTDNGTLVRFTFDCDKDHPDDSKLYIQGTLDMTDYTLRNVTYHGIKARSGSVVQGTKDKDNDILLTFTFRGMRQDDDMTVLPVTNVKQFYCLPSSNKWQYNSEFKPNDNTQRIVSYSGTLIMLVLDCSSSLGNSNSYYSDFNRMKEYARDFVDMVAKNAMPFTLESPQNCKAEKDDNDYAVNVSWDAVRGADYYQVYRRNSSSYYANYELIADHVTSCSWTDDTPQKKDNDYKVCAVGYGMTSNMSSPSSVVSFSLDTPQNTACEISVKNDKLVVNVSWDAVKYAEGYQIYRREGDYWWRDYNLIADSIKSTSYIDEPSSSGTYNYYVKAIGHGMVSGSSNSVGLEYSMPVPQNVVSQLTLKKNSLAINVTWDAVKIAEKYQVYRGNSYGDYELVADNVTTNSWLDKSPLSGDNYYRVRAIGHGLESSDSETSEGVSFSMPTPNNVVSELITDNGNLAVSVTWNPVTSKFKTSDKSFEKYEWESMITDDFDKSLPITKIRILNQRSSSSSYCCISFTTSPNGNEGTDRYWISFNTRTIGDNMLHGQEYGKYISDCTYIGDNWYEYEFSRPVYFAYYQDNCPRGQVKVVTEKSKSEVSNLDLSSGTLWAVVNMAEKYQVYRRNSNSYYGDYELVADNVTTNSWIDKSPSSGNTYYYRIRAIGHGLESSDSETSEGVSLSMPTPQNVTSEMTLKGSNYVVNVTWDAVKIAEKYQVYRSNSSGYYANYELIADDVTTNSWVDNAPTLGNNYYKIKAVGYDMESYESDVTSVNFSLSSTPTNVVGALALSSKNLVIKVNWDAVENATSYNVYRSDNYYGDYTKVAENVKTNSWTDKSPRVGSNYYKIQAVDHGLTSQMSSSSEVVNCALNTPENVKSELALNKNQFVIKVTWDAVEFAESYLVYRSTNEWSDDYTLVAENVKSNSWMDQNPLEDNTYYYKVVASGHGLKSKQSYRTDGVSLKLSTPSNVTGELFVNKNKLAIRVKWDAVSLAESYIIYRSNDSWYGSFEKVAENVTSNSWIDKNPLGGSNYYRVVAVGHGLTSNQSNSSDWVNYSIPAPTNVKSEQALRNNKVVIDLSWDEVKVADSYSAESYIVYRSDSDYGEYVKIADNITSSSWTDESPMDGDNYYKIAAYGYGVTGTQSSYTYQNKR